MLDRKEYEAKLQTEREEQIARLSDYLAHYIRLNAEMRGQPVAQQHLEEKMKKVASIPISRTGRDAEEVADELVENVLSASMLIQHPRFFSFVPSAVSPYSLAGSILSDIYNANTCGFQLAPTVGLVEEKLIAWMGSLIGFDENCGGVFTSGGSLSNLTGMIAARHKLLTEDEYPIGCAYLSDQAHSSVRKGLRLMGVRSDCIRILESDGEFKMRPDLLEEAIRADLAAGKKPFLIIGTVGTTNTGSIDPLEEMGKIKEKYGLWMHIDGAYGGSILFSEIYRNLAKGTGYADSMSWDTHKWAMQVYSCSCLIAKNKKDLIETYAEHPEYLADIMDAEHSDGWDLGIEMSRPARAVKLWFTVQAMGTDLLSDIIDYSFFNASVAQQELLKYPDWEQTSAPMCGTLTFRYVPAHVPAEKLDDLNAAISRAIIAENFAYVVTTVLKGKRVLRLNLINGNTQDTDVVATVQKLDEIARRLAPDYRA